MNKQYLLNKDVEYYNQETQACLHLKTKNTENKKNLLANYIKEMNDEQKFKFWIKTLLGSFNVFPEIIKTIDRIIELQASTVSFASDIYNKEGSTYNQFEKVINLTERKNSLLNIYIMSKELIKTLSEEDMCILEKKYIYDYSVEDISRELEISLRTVYRRLDKVIDEIYFNSIKKNWSLKFIENQIKEEGWLKERFIKSVNDYLKNTNYKTECNCPTCYNKSSSES
jgi:hypothetical protein